MKKIYVKPEASALCINGIENLLDNMDKNANGGSINTNADDWGARERQDIGTIDSPFAGSGVSNDVDWDF